MVCMLWQHRSSLAVRYVGTYSINMSHSQQDNTDVAVTIGTAVNAAGTLCQEEVDIRLVTDEHDVGGGDNDAE